MPRGVTVPGAVENYYRIPGAKLTALDRSAPLYSAHRFVFDKYSVGGRRTLQHNADGFLRWDGSAYEPVSEAAILKELYTWMDLAIMCGRSKEGVFFERPFLPKKSDVEVVLHALKAVCLLETPAPAWLSQRGNRPDLCFVVIAPNGWIDMRRHDRVEPGTPELLATRTTPVAIDLRAPEPRAWLTFLKELYDEQGVRLLREWMGYCLTRDTSQQKILFVLGPPRSGKGTIGRIIRALLGPENCCGPSLASLATPFGLGSLLNSSLAIVSDARLSARSDESAVTERLLKISGQDAVEVERKYHEAETVVLRSRIQILTNELPRLRDASGAIANRMLVLRSTTSFLGKEDPSLTDKLLRELPSILRWVIEGYDEFHDRGHFEQTSIGLGIVADLQEMGSPVKAFVTRFCETGLTRSCLVSDLFDAWRMFCAHESLKPGSKSSFSIQLGAAAPSVHVSRPRQEGAKNPRRYMTIDLTSTTHESLDVWRSSTGAAGEEDTDEGDCPI
jgi:putative DNA primase/helicase